MKKTDRKIITRTCIHIINSHEGVQGVLMWGFWDQAHWKPDAALVNGDNFVVNRAGAAYIR